jgi:hypothetical protein
MSYHGELAQLVERVLSMHEVTGSIPVFSIFFFATPTRLLILRSSSLIFTFESTGFTLI